MKNKQNYSDRRRMRHRISFILIVVISVSYVILTSVFSLNMSIFNTNKVLQTMSESNYYDEVYKELVSEVEMVLVLNGLPSALASETIEFDMIMVAASQQAESDLSEGNFQSDGHISLLKLQNGILDYLEEQDVTLSEDANRGLRNILEDLSLKYSQMLRYPVASQWLVQKKEFDTAGKKISIILTILIIVSVITLIQIQHYKRKGLIYLAYGIGSVSVLMILAVGFILLTQFNESIILMESGKRIYEQLRQSGCIIFLITNVIGLLASISVYSVSKTTRAS